MQKSYECEVATHIGPESCGAARKGGVEALTGERAGREFRERVGPRETCHSKTCPGHRAGLTRRVRWSGYVKQQERIRSCGSRRFCTTFTTWKRCAWPTSA